MATDTWNESNGYQDWDTAGNWSRGIPGASDTAVIAAGSDPCVITADTNPVTVSALVVNAQMLVDHDSQSTKHTYLTVTHGVTVGSNGNFIIDNDANNSVAEGSTVVIKGTLKNGHDVSIGSAGAATYVTDVTVGAIDNREADGGFLVTSGPAGYGSTALHVNSAAGFGVAGTVVGYVVTVQGADAQIDFKSGSITKIAAGSFFTLNGANALVTSGGHTTYNSALTRLSQIAGTFTLASGAKDSITGNVDESGTLSVDHGSRVNISGTLTNDNSSTNGHINVNQNGGFGPSGGGKTILTVGSIVDDPSTQVNVSGGSTAADESIIYDKSAAGFGQAGVVDGNVSVSGYGLIQFSGRGKLTKIASGSGVYLDGPNAFIADAGYATYNSALTQLSEVDGEFSLQDGATDSITGDVHVPGRIDVDSGSRLNVSGKLSNDSSSNGVIAVSSEGERTILNVGSFENVPTSGFPARLSVSGGSTATDQAIMYVSSAAGFGKTGTVDGAVTVSGNAYIQFKSGQIKEIDSDGSLTLVGDEAFVALGSDRTTNSALTGLATVAGTLTLQDGASLSTGALTNSGTINLYSGGDGASTLTVKGSFVDSGGVRVDGDTGSGNIGRLYVTGGTSGTGSIDLGNDSRVTLAGGIYRDQQLYFGGTTNAVATIGHAPSANFNVANFGAGDTLDLRGETVTKLSYANSTLTLTLSTGQTQNIAFTGSFSGLTHKSDGNGGTDIITTSSSESPMADAAEPDIFAQYANLAQSAAFDGGAGSGAASTDSSLHASFAEMMSYALDGGSGAPANSLHEAAGSGSTHAATLFAAALHGH